MPRFASQPASRLLRRPSTLLLAAALLGAACNARADVFYLKTGGTVSGKLVRSTDDSLVVRTTVGTVTLARSDVVRIESAPTPFEEYEQRRAAMKDTPAGHMTLAAWCEEAGLGAERRRHLLRALELDPDYEHARRALGHVRVGSVWMDARRIAELNPESAKNEARRHRLVDEIRRGYFRRVLTLRNHWLDSGDERRQAAGRDELLAIHNPLAIRPLTEVLTEGGTCSREVLIACLAGFGQDEATLNLGMMALLDPDTRIRGLALEVLRKRADPRIVDQLRVTMREGNDFLVARAATALGALRAAEAVPDLIDLLRAERIRWVDVPVPVLLRWVDVFDGASLAPIGPGWVYSSPDIWVLRGLASWGTNVDIFRQQRLVTVYRTEVLESLEQITGENFGFDAKAWQRWYEAKSGG